MTTYIHRQPICFSKPISGPDFRSEANQSLVKLDCPWLWAMRLKMGMSIRIFLSIFEVFLKLCFGMVVTLIPKGRSQKRGLQGQGWTLSIVLHHFLIWERIIKLKNISFHQLKYFETIVFKLKSIFSVESNTIRISQLKLKLLFTSAK